MIWTRMKSACEGGMRQCDDVEVTCAVLWK